MIYTSVYTPYISPGVVIITLPASPLPTELVATTENVYVVIGVKLVII